MGSSLLILLLPCLLSLLFPFSSFWHSVFKHISLLLRSMSGSSTNAYPLPHPLKIVEAGSIKPSSEQGEEIKGENHFNRLHVGPLPTGAGLSLTVLPAAGSLPPT